MTTEKPKRSTISKARASDVTETDLASEKMGRNELQGDDQSQIQNQRHAVPDVKQDADRSHRETAEKTDKDVRAKRDLGKGRRHSPDHPYNQGDR